MPDAPETLDKGEFAFVIARALLGAATRGKPEMAARVEAELENMYGTVDPTTARMVELARDIVRDLAAKEADLPPLPPYYPGIPKR